MCLWNYLKNLLKILKPLFPRRILTFLFLIYSEQNQARNWRYDQYPWYGPRYNKHQDRRQERWSEQGQGGKKSTNFYFLVLIVMTEVFAIWEKWNQTQTTKKLLITVTSASYLATLKSPLTYTLEYLQELLTLVKKMENEREKDLIIESRFHRQLIGPKGESIQKLRDDFANVQISFPDLGSKSDIVKLRGPKDDVEKCSKVLNKVISRVSNLANAVCWKQSFQTRPSAIWERAAIRLKCPSSSNFTSLLWAKEAPPFVASGKRPTLRLNFQNPALILMWSQSLERKKMWSRHKAKFSRFKPKWLTWSVLISRSLTRFTTPWLDPEGNWFNRSWMIVEVLASSSLLPIPTLTRWVSIALILSLISTHTVPDDDCIFPVETDEKEPNTVPLKNWYT